MGYWSSLINAVGEAQRQRGNDLDQQVTLAKLREFNQRKELRDADALYQMQELGSKSQLLPVQTQHDLMKAQLGIESMPQDQQVSGLVNQANSIKANDVINNYANDKAFERDQLRSKPSSKGVFNADLGGWVYEPSANNPQGVFVPVAGAKKQNKSPMSVALQKELIDTDSDVQTNQNVVNTLDQAKIINNKALFGVAPKMRAKVASVLPDWMLPDFIASKEEADATINLDNMMTGQALESLKAVFGGMPTEGERKILLDMQASVDKTPKQREEIMNRARTAAVNRMMTAKMKSKAIRGGTYLTEGVDPSAGQEMQAVPAQGAPVQGGIKFLGFEGQ